MANSYTKLYVQIVFAVKGREGLIACEWEDQLYQYITGIVRNKGQKLLAINGMPDHIHIFIGMKADCCLSDLVREIKKSSNNWINENKFTKNRFYWQEGFGAFSYSHSHIPRVCNYVCNQKKIHLRRTFKGEYLDFLRRYEVEYNEKFLFEWNEEVK